jgi:hypothetical protein
MDSMADFDQALVIGLGDCGPHMVLPMRRSLHRAKT